MNEALATEAAAALREGKRVLVLVERSQFVRDAVEHVSRLGAPTLNLVVRSAWAPTRGSHFDVIAVDAHLEQEQRDAWLSRLAPGGQMLSRVGA